MHVLLIPVDGSEYSDRAVDYAIGRVKASKDPVRLHLLNVQMPIVTVNVKLFVSKDSLESYYREEGEKALASATDRLQQQQLEATPHISVGDAGKII